MGGEGNDCDGGLLAGVARRFWKPISSAEGPVPAGVRSMWKRRTASMTPSTVSCCTMRSEPAENVSPKPARTRDHEKIISATRRTHC